MKPNCPLFNPPRLTSKYLGSVLASGWLTAGPECEKLRYELGVFYSWEPSAIVLGASATACWQALLDVVGAASVDITTATWPGMLNARPYDRGRRAPPPVHVRVDTCIGGSALYDEERRKPHRGLHEDYRVLDACHSAEPDRTYDASLISFYPTKLIPGAEGGALFLERSCSHLALELEMALNCGQVPAYSRGGAALRGGFGRKGNMTDVAAALNREALELSSEYAHQIYCAWCELRRAAEEVDVGYRPQKGRPYLFQMTCPATEVQAVRGRLAERQGVPSAWNFPPAGLVTLPCFPGLTREQAEDIVNLYKECR
jgi:dTDP-4-amino-4,6-dideoxygalactose transaminase